MKSLMPQIDSNDGLFHNGNPATGEQGTRVTDTWLNNLQDRVRDVQAEAHYVLQKAGFQLVENKQTQLYEAIVKIIDDNRKTASLTQKGETKLYTGYDSQSEDLALTPKTAYQLKQLIDSNTRSLGNVIPNSKKSSAIDSNSTDTVATSKAAKIAYDKGVEAKTTAETANNNANGRVSKSGDTMTGLLSVPKIHLTENRTGESLKFGDDAWLGDVDMGNAVGVKGQQHPEQGYIAFGAAKKRFGFNGRRFMADAPLNVPDISSQGLWVEHQHAVIRIKSSAHDSAGIDFSVNNGTHPHAEIETVDVGNYSTDIRFHTTPRGSDYNRDRRHHIVTFAPEGHIWAKPYGWFHDYFHHAGKDYVQVTGSEHHGGLNILKPDGKNMRFERQNNSFKFWAQDAYEILMPEKSGTVILDNDFTYQKIGDFEIRRYPDGTMIQTFRFNPPGNRVGAQDRKFTFNWAAAFVEKPKIWIQHQNQEKSGYGSLDMTMNTVESETTNTKVTFWVWEWYYNNNLISFDFLAIGRWK